MYDEEMRAVARAAMAGDESLNAISNRLGVSRATLRDWHDRPVRAERSTACPRCSSRQVPAEPYAHLLGLYLGDGCLSKHRKEVYALRIACDNAYPRLIEEAVEAIAAVHPSRPVHRVQAVGYTSILSYWKHWPCLFPQHGSGPKHRRRIELAEWQWEIVAERPEMFLRGLFNADGVHPTEGAERHEFYLMCEDIEALLDTLAGKGVDVLSEITEAGWGRLATIPLPSGARLPVYQPLHPVAYNLQD